jgi:L-methionine (R)-S-oxide reductase
VEDAHIRSEVEAALDGSGDAVVVLMDVVSILAKARPSWDWVGIYVLAGDTLVLGPYTGAPTEHTRIPVGVGVCGTAVARGFNMVVDDVARLDNYLACSATTRSELVVLIRHDGQIVGQFDVDSDQPAAFGPADEALLEELAALVATHCRILADRARTLLG